VIPVSPPTSTLPYSADLDGGYLWLGVTGAATHDDGTWDSVFGLEAATVRVRERAFLSVLGVGLAGARVAADERWRVSLDLIAGTRVARNTVVGLSLGPTADFAELAHPSYGATAMAWVFVGITPYVRIGVRNDGSAYVDLGAQLSLPIARF
jgi:hypothetical protein